jgi:hypothetical protein
MALFPFPPGNAQLNTMKKWDPKKQKGVGNESKFLAPRNTKAGPSPIHIHMRERWQKKGNSGE